jgi:hypothetical protein
VLHIPVEMVRGHYAEFKVLVDDAVVIEAGPLAMIGWVPSDAEVVEAVRQAAMGSHA